MQQIKKQVKDFVADLAGKKVLVLHHTDTDGICSAALFERLAPPADYTFRPTAYLSNYSTQGYDALVFLDLSGDGTYKGHKPILIIDHHGVYKKKMANGVVAKPQFYSKVKPYKYPAVKMVNDLLDAPKELGWLVAIGLTGDISDEQWKTFVKKVGISKKDLLLAVRMIDSGRQIGLNELKEASQIVRQADSIDDIFNSKLRSYFNRVDKELNKLREAYKRRAERHGNILLFEIKTKFLLGSTLSTIVSFETPDKIIILYRKSGDWISINARHQGDKYKVNELLEKAIKGFSGAIAGGHPPAAGASVRRKDFDLFKKRLFELVG